MGTMQPLRQQRSSRLKKEWMWQIHPRLLAFLFGLVHQDMHSSLYSITYTVGASLYCLPICSLQPTHFFSWSCLLSLSVNLSLRVYGCPFPICLHVHSSYSFVHSVSLFSCNSSQFVFYFCRMPLKIWTPLSSTRNHCGLIQATKSSQSYIILANSCCNTIIFFFFRLVLD